MGRPKGSKNQRPAKGWALNPSGYVILTHWLGTGLHRQRSRVIVERVLGRRLPTTAPVHHVNTDRSDDRPNNLVVLQSNAEHMELHRKMRVREAGGDPWQERLCCSCGLQPMSAFYRPRGSPQCKRCARVEALRRIRLVDREVKRARNRAYYYRKIGRQHATV